MRAIQDGNVKLVHLKPCLTGEPDPERASEGGWLLDTRLLIINRLTSSIDYRAVGRTNRLRMLKLLA